MNEVVFDSEIMSFIQDLGLVLKMSREGKEWWTCWLTSQFSRYPLCERYKAHLIERDAENARLLKRLAEANKPRSKYYHGDPGTQFSLDL